jgi:tetratricopeptide (TPR) repeat protein
METWESHGHLSEGLRWLDTALKHRGSLSQPTLARVLFGKGYLLLRAGGHHEQATALLEESLSLYEQLGDTTWTVEALSLLGWAAEQAGTGDRGLANRERAVTLARGQQDRWTLAVALGNLGLSLVRLEHRAGARAALEESLALGRAVGNVQRIATALGALGMLELDRGDRARASSMLEEALAMDRTLGHLRDTSGHLSNLSVVALHEGKYDRAANLLDEALPLARQAGDGLYIALCLWGAAAVAAARGQPVRAVRLWGAAAKLGYRLMIPPFAVRPLEERLLASARETLGEDEFRAQWASGQAMRQDDAIAYGLENH